MHVYLLYRTDVNQNCIVVARSLRRAKEIARRETGFNWEKNKEVGHLVLDKVKGESYYDLL